MDYALIGIVVGVAMVLLGDMGPKEWPLSVRRGLVVLGIAVAVLPSASVFLNLFLGMAVLAGAYGVLFALFYGVSWVREGVNSATPPKPPKADREPEGSGTHPSRFD